MTRSSDKICVLSNDMNKQVHSRKIVFLCNTKHGKEEGEVDNIIGGMDCP